MRPRFYNILMLRNTINADIQKAAYCNSEKKYDAVKENCCCHVIVPFVIIVSSFNKNTYTYLM